MYKLSCRTDHLTRRISDCTHRPQPARELQIMCTNVVFLIKYVVMIGVCFKWKVSSNWLWTAWVESCFFFNRSIQRFVFVIARTASLRWGVGRETLYCRALPYLVCIGKGVKRAFIGELENFVFLRLPIFGMYWEGEKRAFTGELDEKLYIAAHSCIWYVLGGGEANLRWGVGWKTLYCHTCPYLVYVGMQCSLAYPNPHIGTKNCLHAR